jgi:hypothetical protein
MRIAAPDESDDDNGDLVLDIGFEPNISKRDAVDFDGDVLVQDLGNLSL